MIRHPVKFFFKLVATLAIVGVLVIVAGVWRLSNGPVPLSMLVGTVESLINENIDGLKVSIEDVVLEKAADGGGVQFRFIDLQVRDPNNKLVARTSRAAFRLSTSHLMNGEFSPTHLELLGPKMFVHRKLDGSFRLGFGDITIGGKTDGRLGDNSKSDIDTENAVTPNAPADGENIENAEDVIALLQATLLSDNLKGPAARLREIKIINASLTLYDEPNSTTWASPNANVTLARAEDGLTADVDANIKVGDESFSVTMQSAYKKTTQRMSVTIAVLNVNPETLARHVPDLEALKVLHLPLSGTASAEIAVDGKVLSAGLDIVLGAGKLVFSKKQKDEIGVRAGRIALKYDQEKRLLVISPSQIDLSGGKASLSGYLIPEGDSGNPFSHFGYNLELANIKIVDKKTIEIDRIIVIGTADSDKAIINLETAELHAGEARLSASGEIRLKGEAPGFRLSGNIENIATAKLLEIWPLEAARGLRIWISENLDAFVPRGSFDVNLTQKDIARLVDGNDLPKDFLMAEFEVTDATVRYFEGLPPLKQAYGRGILKDADFEFFGEGGVAIMASGKKVEMTKAHFHTNWAIADPAIGKVRVFVKGTASAVMELLDNDPLNFGRKMGINPKTIGGKAVGDLVFTMPLLADLPVEKVDMLAKAKLTGIKMPKAFGDFDVTKGNLDLNITMFGLKGSGTIDLKGTKASLVWTENFGVRGKRTSEFRLKTVLDDAARKRMGIELSKFISGPTAITFTLKGSGTNLNEAHVEADLSKATLFRDSIGWKSPPGAKTTASLDMKFIKGGAVDIKNIKVVSKKRNVFVVGNLGINSKGQVAHFSLPEIRLGKLNNYSVSGERQANGQLDVAVRGKSFDARALITNALRRGKKSAPSGKKKNQEIVRLSAKIDTVYAHNKQVFKNLTSRLVSVGDDVIAIRTTATINGSKSFRFDFGEEARKPHNLVITSKDAGATLKAFNLYSKIVKGTLELEASLSPSGSGKTSKGRLKIKDFNIANDDRLKGLTKTVVSNDEEIETIFRDSVSFSSFRMPFELRKNQLVIGNSILKGAILGASGRGTINTKTNALNIEGTLIPIYAVNSIIGEIPLLGKILVGRKGEGLFGVTFTLRGTSEKPEFSINPVSALAPGFLRQFFEKGTSAPSAAKAKKSAPISLQPKQKRKKEKPVIIETSEN